MFYCKRAHGETNSALKRIDETEFFSAGSWHVVVAIGLLLAAIMIISTGITNPVFADPVTCDQSGTPSCYSL